MAEMPPRPATGTDGAPLRVALISSGLGHVTRGVETWMLELARHLPGGIAPEIWPGRPLTGGGEVPVVSLGSLSRESRWFGPFSWHRRYYLEQFTALPRALRELRRRRMDLAYCGDPILSWNLKRFRRRHGARVVFMNGMRLTPRWLQDYDGIHLLAPPYFEEARGIVPAAKLPRFFAVPHFADTERFRPPTAAERTAARREWNLPDDAFVVLTVGPVGRISGKRLEHLAGEVAALPSSALLVSAGGDEDGADAVRSECGAALGSRMRFLGRVDRERMGRLFHAADVYSLGSLAEPFSIAILEALASGLPVVHHHDPVMAWQTGIGGRPVDMSVPGGGRAALESLRADGALRARLASAARELAESRYSPGAVCAALAGEFRRIVQLPRPAHP